MFFMSCVCHAFVSVHCCLVVTSFVMFNCVTFSCGILVQVWYLIVLIPDLCHLSYFIVNHKVLVNHLVKLVQEKVWLGELTVPL